MRQGGGGNNNVRSGRRRRNRGGQATGGYMPMSQRLRGSEVIGTIAGYTEPTTGLLTLWNAAYLRSLLKNYSSYRIINAVFEWVPSASMNMSGSTGMFQISCATDANRFLDWDNNARRDIVNSSPGARYSGVHTGFRMPYMPSAAGNPWRHTLNFAPTPSTPVDMDEEGNFWWLAYAIKGDNGAELGRIVLHYDIEVTGPVNPAINDEPA